MQSDHLHVRIVDGDLIALVELSGEIDISTTGALSHCLRRWEAATNVVVDMEGVSFMDSAGLSVLLVERHRLHRGGGSLTLRNIGDAIRRILQITGVEELFTQPVA
jgi:anti-sigma B factor antagonist